MLRLGLWRVLSGLGLALALVFAPPAVARDKGAQSGAIRNLPDRQASLVRQQVAALPPQRPGRTDIYAIGLAGFAAQNVFLNELEGALAAMGRALPLAGTVRLINNTETVGRLPLATKKNFAAAVRGVARVMDKNEDVLLLFITSHGTKRGVVLQLPGVLTRLSPREVAAVLDREGIRNRVVIVSACYSGIFVRPLANKNSIVLTAADAKNASFGCADGREWTYFGDALFRHSLKPGVDFKLAFSNARGLITGWEKLERLKPSNPQGHFGDALARKLAPLVETTGSVQ